MSATIWLTGLPGAGKTTLAERLAADLRAEGRSACVLDGDVLRRGLSADLGFSDADRAEQVRRTGEVASLLARQGIVAIVALVSPFAAERAKVRVRHAGFPFAEVWVRCPAAVCAERDPKGLYARARTGLMVGLTGHDSPFEPPPSPELVIDTDTVTVEVGVAALRGWLRHHAVG